MYKLVLFWGHPELHHPGLYMPAQLIMPIDVSGTLFLTLLMAKLVQSRPKLMTRAKATQRTNSSLLPLLPLLRLFLRSWSC